MTNTVSGRFDLADISRFSDDSTIFLLSVAAFMLS
jgi:hypothetical protein